MSNMKNRKLWILIALMIFPLPLASSNHRLPNNAKAHHYILKIEPYMIFENSTFHGTVEILVEIVIPTWNLTLHSAKLTIRDEATVLIGARGTITPNQHIFEENDFLVLCFKSILQPGIYILKLTFTGLINYYLTFDFYGATGLCWYRNNNGNQTKHFLTTNLQPTYARQVFPCWDEPAFKATFDISIKHFANYTAHSIMPLKTRILNNRDDDEKIWTNFKTTPLMSTYHVTFAISDFFHVQHKGKLLSIWSDNSSVESLLNETLEMSSTVLQIFKDYTKISYMLPKIDIVAFPSLDKIENWGLIYFWKESILKKTEFLFEDKVTMSSVIVPAIAQQWFGNLVTPHWWTDLWITSGLSTYLEYFVTAKVLNIPSLVDFYLIREIQEVPLKWDTNNFDEYLMEDITLSNKPVKMMHMLSSLITKDVFQTGVRKILHTFKFKTIATDDFWCIMQESLNKSSLRNKINIKMVMESYVLQTGYPIINVYRNYTTGTIKLTQECPSCLEHINKNNNTEKKWWIPINFATSESFNFTSTFATHWLKPDQNEFTIEGVNPDDFVIFDKQVTGYYRVNYDERSWRQISDYLNSEKYVNIHYLNRAKLLQDVTWFWRNKKLDTDFFITFVSYLKRENNVIPWLQLHDIFSLLLRIDVNTLQHLVIPLVNSVIERRNFDNEENNQFLVKNLLQMARTWKEKLKYYYPMNNEFFLLENVTMNNNC